MYFYRTNRLVAIMLQNNGHAGQTVLVRRTVKTLPPPSEGGNGEKTAVKSNGKIRKIA